MTIDEVRATLEAIECEPKTTEDELEWIARLTLALLDEHEAHMLPPDHPDPDQVVPVDYEDCHCKLCKAHAFVERIMEEM